MFYLYIKIKEMPRNPNVNVDGKYVICKTYREFKKMVRKLITESDSKKVFIYRERRGEWGEWFEHWEIIRGKPKITKEGWS